MQVGGFRHTTSDRQVGGKGKSCEVRTSCCRQSCFLFLPQRSVISQRNFLPPHELEHEPDCALSAVLVPCLVQVSGTPNTWVAPWCTYGISCQPTSRERQIHIATAGICPALAHFPSQTIPAVEVNLIHHLLPSYLPPTGLSVMIRGFLQRYCCQSPSHRPNSSTDNVWLITYPTH